jgi:GrpB-like predicted nucleotidyltransferase (UPF0157 family)
MMFEQEAEHLRAILPSDIIQRIEHFGSTSIPGLASKPIIDMLVEVDSLDETRKRIVPVLQSEGYDYFWRPEFDKPPFYAWFIKRGPGGIRTHHIHMVESDSKLWGRLLFRDYLREHPVEAKRYENLKMKLSRKYPEDRISYTKEKSSYIASITEKAAQFYYHR